IVARAIGANRDPAHRAIATLRRIEIVDETRVPLEQVDIIFGAHRAAAAPGFVADTKQGDAERLLPAIGDPLAAKRGAAVGGHIFQPVRGFAHAARPDVDRYVGLAA